MSTVMAGPHGDGDGEAAVRGAAESARAAQPVTAPEPVAPERAVPAPQAPPARTERRRPEGASGRSPNGYAHRVQIIAPPRPKRPPGPVRVTGLITSVGPWSVFKLSLFFCFLGMLAMLGALAAVYFLLESNGSLTAVEKLVRAAEIDRSFEFDSAWIFTRLFWIGCLATLVAAVVATLVAILYNAISDLIGGLKITIQEPESAAEPPRPESRPPINWSASTETVPTDDNGHRGNAPRRASRPGGARRAPFSAGPGPTAGGGA